MHLTPRLARPSPNLSVGRAFDGESVGGGAGRGVRTGVSAGSVAPKAPTVRRLRFSSSGGAGRSNVNDDSHGGHAKDASAMELETEIERSLAQGGAVDTAAQGGAVDTTDEQVFEGGGVEAKRADMSSRGSAAPKRRRSQAGKKRQTASAKIKSHRRFSHARGRRLRKTAMSGYVDGLVFEGDFEPCDCATCMRKNARKAAFKKKAFRRATKKGWRIHSDLKEFPVRSKKGFKYSICFVDDATRRGKTYAMKKKDEALEMFKRFIREECIPRNIRVCVLRSDNGGEYISEEFCMWCRTHQVSREYSPPHGQSADGVSECYWREVARSVRAILWDQQRGDEWWPAALEFANETRNHLDSDAVDGSGVPEVEWTGGPVDVTHWRVPLSTSWSYIEKGNRDGGTLGDQRQQGVLVGYATDSKCYQVLPDDGDIVLNRRYEDVIVDETEHAPKNARRARSDLHTIIEETSEDAVDDGDRDSIVHLGESSEDEVEIVEDERPAKKAKACVGGSSAEAAATKATTTNESSEPLLEISAPGVKGFYTMTKARSIRQLADLFACDPTEYLRLLLQYEGWYQQLKSIDSVVAPGSDVPVPQQAMESHKALRSTNKKKKQEGGGKKNMIARKEPARRTDRSASGRSTAGKPRRSRRLGFLQEEARKDAVAMLALAVDFERQATAATKAPRVAPAAPARQEYDASAFFVADCGGDDDRDYGLAALMGQALLDQWRTPSTSTTTSSPMVLYDDEPHDRVYYEALAAGEISLLNLQGVEAPKSQKKAYSGPHRVAWMASEDREWEGLWKKGAFEDVAYTGQRLHHLLWIYKVKSSGLPKSRLCADGRQQDPSTYGDIASPTMRTTSFRILLAIAAMNHWGMWADDVTQAFLEAERPKDKPLWASYPSGYCVPPEEGGTGRSSSSGGSSGARRPSHLHAVCSLSGSCTVCTTHPRASSRS